MVKLQHILINDHEELYVFSHSDILKMIKGFNNYGYYFNKDKIIQALINLTLET
jgi:hypothetical protein